ncbi:sulfatase-like hydrolase/transferase [Undibacterium seohonense]|uniref:Sulfatase-like hydrolase/transferase n=1 Tax=Undibacterium seohonense TaxID=1344950 RepID=A0ABR6X2Y1_9BURK|nr:sulfatase-like hydrolase/transferase [Undibacterium seohonense]MBC3806993.1 sulfatase-like hydrolase/transferase [Undibacterium seohonense]
MQDHAPKASNKDHPIKDRIEQIAAERDARPNILMIMVDQLCYPSSAASSAADRAADQGGFAPDIKSILSFVDSLEGNEFVQHYPGFCKLREYATVFTDHTIAESACIPSRASIMTGQYGPRTGVTQTDGLFKNGDASNFPWLPANGAPTAGDYFRELGYSTHYFGKWHVSDPADHTLQAYGFGDWEMSWPEPHGSLTNNMGVYRDYQFADLACSFLRRRGLGVPYSRASSTAGDHHPNQSFVPTPAPFFAVCSFTNPHDIATYPTLPRALMPAVPDANVSLRELIGPGGSVPIPTQGTVSAVPQDGTFRVPLNPTGLPQHCATATSTQNENLLNNKPRAQFDASYKVALGLAAKTGLAAAQGKGGSPEDVLENAVKATLASTIPFQLQKHADAASVGFLQYYAYMISMVDRHILNVLTTLEQAGLRENTIVVFVSDHGEFGAAHGMQIEKWHGAYQEVVHVPFLICSPTYNTAADAPIAIDAQTSHIDLLPTLLALSGAQQEQIERARRNLAKTHKAAPLPGANLLPVMAAGQGPVCNPDGSERLGVLFATDDMITEPLPMDDDPHNQASWQQYAVYATTVELLRTEPTANSTHPYVPELTAGPVVQPAHVRALRSAEWKLVRYCDPWSERPVADQWELYNLRLDPVEAINLLVYDGVFPTPIDHLPGELNAKLVINIAENLRAELARQEAHLLSPYPSQYPSASLI